MIAKTRLFTYLGFRLSGDLGQWTMYTYCRKRPTFFLKSPPLTPPTLRQVHQRNLFRLVGYLWRGLSPAQRATWEQLAQAAHLRITGYNLFLHWVLRTADATLATLIHQTGINPLE
jgi:hypothetical protein